MAKNSLEILGCYFFLLFLQRSYVYTLWLPCLVCGILSRRRIIADTRYSITQFL